MEQGLEISRTECSRCSRLPNAFGPRRRKPFQVVQYAVVLTELTIYEAVECGPAVVVCSRVIHWNNRAKEGQAEGIQVRHVEVALAVLPLGEKIRPNNF